MNRPTRRPRRGQPDDAASRRKLEASRYLGAVMRQKTERLIATGKVVPARITMALDYRGLYGPEVDWACKANEPDVDLWECGLKVPSPEQVVALSELTRFPIGYFYLPIKPGPLLGSVTVCSTRPRKCERIEPDVVDENGVLHPAGETRQPPIGAWQQALDLGDL